MNYAHLTLENKVAIKTLRNEGYSIMMIARKLGIPKSTVHRSLSTPKDKVQKTSINIEKKYTKFLGYLRKTMTEKHLQLNCVYIASRCFTSLIKVYLWSRYITG